MSRPLRVLQLITSLAGGAGLYAVQLARHLDRERFSVELAFGPGYPLDAEVAAAALPHRLLRWSRRAGPLSTTLGSIDLWRLLRRGSYDIVHAHCSLAGAIGRPLARLAGVPRVLFTVHAFASQAHQPALKRRLLLAVERALDRCTDRYCVGTRAFQQQLAERRISDAGRVTVIPLGIDIPPLPDTAQRLAARAALGLPADVPVIAAAGRFETQKGFRYLIDALPAVLVAAPRTRLVLFGEGPLQPALAAQVARLDLGHAVVFAGWRKDLARQLAAADVYCLASLWEAFGYVLLEAMAAGAAIVATRVDGVPEVLDDGRLGELVAPADVPALAAALSSLLADDARRAALAAAGRAALETRYPLARMIASHAELYLDLAARRPC